MNDYPRLAVDLTALPQAGNDSDIAERRAKRAARRMRRGVPKQIREWDAREKAKRGEVVAPQRVGDRWRVLVSYRLDGDPKHHESLPVFRTADEARDRGEYFLKTVTATAREVLLWS